ncbi:Hypothetical protein CpMEX30_2127 [Corynebacterium pseudotuberculosis]|uniref:Transposase n=1 Tax=Corynebacterium pseudotuberculosis 258 TaxID=1168865 RepID=A0AAX1FKH6_CORPS|nr:hypothetical protein CPCIP5297_10485 [Corynebacterium pseudotuberculosis CIP 52.97]AFB73362.2 hypothetical protein CP316_10470 [Corynebacterium pseudotuberculosis 316]APQ55102.1 Hypothetical protein CpMEX30_2127 [Corynebacterium pseudotuberculosis]QGW56973.1 hypothetical protein CP258_10485 [Corynebacterium pseudotuberculosis 258]APQ57185.1 Hypothetical protein CpMEX31_2122 [Corynebacterium pseudotuberculosis]
MTRRKNHRSVIHKRCGQVVYNFHLTLKDFRKIAAKGLFSSLLMFYITKINPVYNSPNLHV